MAVDEQLTTGWESNVAVGDTLLRRYLFHHAALDAAFTLAGGGRALDADDVSMADLGRPGGYFNGAVLLTPPADWDAVLARIDRFFRCGRGQACLWSAWPTPDLRDRGWRLSGHPPLLVRPPWSTNPLASSAAADIDVRPVSSAADLAGWERVAIDGYPLPELSDAPAGALAPAALLDDERLRFFVGLDGDRPVAAAVSFASHGIALARLRRHDAGRPPARLLAPARRRTPPGHARRVDDRRVQRPQPARRRERSDSCRCCASRSGSSTAPDPQPSNRKDSPCSRSPRAPTSTATRSPARRRPSTATTPPSTTSSPTATSCSTP